ncbi:MAG: hypothetical protein IT178_01460 [Acidobacteria bacterium]|nr:hypothetical protein [Acidobacteriota bacterium]
MTRSRRLRAAAAAGAIATLAVIHAAAPPADAAQDPAAAESRATADGRITFEADVVVATSVMTEDDKVVEEQPPLRYRVTLRSGQAGPSSEFTFQDARPFPGRGPLTDPTGGFRLVIGPRGMQLFNNKNQPMTELTSPEQSAGLAAMVNDILMTPDPSARRAALRERFGNAQGRQRKMDRFVRRDRSDVEEVMVDPALALPIEVTHTRDGQWERRSSMRYARLADGRYYRAQQRDESPMAAADGQRPRKMVTTTTLAPTRGGGR